MKSQKSEEEYKSFSQQDVNKENKFRTRKSIIYSRDKKEILMKLKSSKSF